MLLYEFEVPIVSRLFFQEIAHNREYTNKFCNVLDNEFNFIFFRCYQNNNSEEPLQFGGYICDFGSIF